jgi:complement component 1 Q subcomponent-binding protein, mitochondrial
LMEDEQGDEEELAARIRFTTVVTKAGKHMVFTCISEDAQATIENVAVSTGGASVDDILKAGSVDEQQYQGPEFSELAEDLQESFHVYLQDHVGINESVASFISMYADYREQAEYVDFLKDAQTVLK